ncbi:SDR family oxidoreductase [Desulfovibrio sp. OttesenSCG-928-G11]|nr:SDR family oxidoreductase [Desulfovibrio sp. OttesenSCG-928-G11]
MSGKTEEKPRARRILVTGGLGYAGGRVAAHLARQGHELYILSRGASSAAAGVSASAGHKAGPGGGLAGLFIKADLGLIDAGELAGLLPAGLEAVVHAASLNEAFLPDYPRRSLLVNSLGTRTLLEALAQKSARDKTAAPLVIYFSTFHVYGRDRGRISEDCQPAPKGDYALTHFFAEEYCRAAMRCGGPPCVILRLSNGYGLAASLKAQKWHLLINDLCRNAVTSGELLLRSDPLARRDFVWLGDAARVVEALLDRRDLAGRLFNVASGQSLSLRETAARIAGAASLALERQIAVRELAPPGEDIALEVDNSALRAALDYSFEDRLEEECLAIMRMLSGHSGPPEAG